LPSPVIPGRALHSSGEGKGIQVVSPRDLEEYAPPLFFGIEVAFATWIPFPSLRFAGSAGDDKLGLAENALRWLGRG
jgi:hypothetical protein